MRGALDHLKEHLVLWYVANTYEVGNAQTQQDGKELSDLMGDKDPESAKELDRLLAVITKNHTVPDAAKLFGPIPEIVAQLQKL